MQTDSIELLELREEQEKRNLAEMAKDAEPLAVDRTTVSIVMAQAVCHRVKAAGIKGKAHRDQTALDMFIGAASVLSFTGHPDLSEALRVSTTYGILVGGYAAAEEMAARPEGKVKAAA